MSGSWKHPEYNPKICAEIRANIEATCHENIGDKIQEAMEAGSELQVLKLKIRAQEQFDFMVKTNGECASHYADVREAFRQYSALPDYNYRELKEEALKAFDVTWNEDGSYDIHPKGMALVY